MGETRLLPISELPSRFRQIFPYVNFNHVQSKVYKTMLETNKPIVVSAPTGSGKTGVFELAIIKLIMDCESSLINTGAIKIVYLAPTKALCSERRDDWANKFSPFNIHCYELTSDITTATNYKNLQQSCILLATPEKWDSITRSWIGHKMFAQAIRLLLIDEVHLVNDGIRGATLEAVISRMKTIRSMIWPMMQDNLRFVAVSATVSNLEDIADWFSTPTSKTEIFQVDPCERPVSLRTVVLGYSVGANINEFSFDNQLNHKVADVIKEYSNQKPTLVFCATRKSAMITATTLVKEGKFDMCFSMDKRKLYLQLSATIRDKTLQETTRFGVAFHHAGLCMGDRRAIESGFIDGHVMILCSTSTLAMGVNLPAHLVIIKNTSFYCEGQFKPYTESSLVQMIGRAGRPQFDTHATAVIMTKLSCRGDIEKMLVGNLIVDSQLHKFLTEHINSEIVLGTIDDDIVARKWIDSTFLRVRLMKNPENYGLKSNSSLAVKENIMINLCKESIALLLKHGMINRTSQGKLESTDSGRAMARHYISLNTMIKLVSLKGTESLRDLLEIVSSSLEVTSDVQLRQEDRTSLNSIIYPKDESHKLRFPVTGDKINTKEKKAFVLIQATFNNSRITENTILQESMRIVRCSERVVNCLREVALMNRDIPYTLLLNVIILSQCSAAKLWEDSIYVSRQIEKIGPILSQNLARNNLTSFDSLRKANPRNIEIFCSRLPPFGSSVQQTCFGLPVYDLKILFRPAPKMRFKIQLLVEVQLVNGQDLRNNQSLPKRHQCTLIVGCPANNRLLLRQNVMDSTLLARPDLTICYGTDVNKTDLPDNFEEIEAHLMSEMFVGLNAKKVVKYIEPEEEFDESIDT